MLLLPEGQKGEARERLTRNTLSKIGERWRGKCYYFCFINELQTLEVNRVLNLRPTHGATVFVQALRRH